MTNKKTVTIQLKDYPFEKSQALEEIAKKKNPLFTRNIFIAGLLDKVIAADKAGKSTISIN